MATAGHDSIPEQALAWIDAGGQAALATVVATWGSAPRPVGSQLAVSGEGEIAGSVSGGCVEGAVVAEALEALEDGTPRVLEFGVTNEEAFAVGLACGGTIRVLVEPVGVGLGPRVELIRDLCLARANRAPRAYVVEMERWSRLLLDGAAGTPLGLEVQAALRDDRSGFATLEGSDWFIGAHNPPLRLAVVGAVHIAQPLMTMAREAGYDATLIDPREAFASEARFPGERLAHDWPDAALKAHGLDARTAVVTLTHDPKIDDPAIETALRSDVFYLGCLGSTRTHAKRVARLVERGFTEAEAARIHAPVGLDIGAKSPAEIAIAILAQITERLRRPETRPERRALAPQGASAEEPAGAVAPDAPVADVPSAFT
jgi:xanthine dehydrogenase accessory factor